jgi:hypothetical protein
LSQRLPLLGSRALFTAAVVALYLMHQDFWFWRTARPLVFGFLPIGLAYHGGYCLLAAGLMWALTTWAWPSHLESDEHQSAADRR